MDAVILATTHFIEKSYLIPTPYLLTMDIRQQNELEIDRIRHILDAFRNGLDSNKKEFEEYVEGYESDQTNKTNNIFAVIGVAPTSAHWPAGG